MFDFKSSVENETTLAVLKGDSAEYHVYFSVPRSDVWVNTFIVDPCKSGILLNTKTYYGPARTRTTTVTYGNN